MKHCPGCKTDKPLEEYNKNRRNKDGLYSYCRSCHAEKAKRDYESNRAARTAQRLRWRAANRDKDKASQERWKERNPESYRRHWQAANKKKREKVLEVVGRGVLACRRCGCDVIELLEINHINGGGAKEIGGKNMEFYRKIVAGERPLDDLELLCKLCNNLHYIELKYGKMPYLLEWEGVQHG